MTATTQPLTAQQLDRAVGAVLGSAAGDALGSQYEFGEPLPDDRAVEFGIGTFGHARGEWTDDTSMAMPLLQALAAGESLTGPVVLGRIAGEWLDWSRTARDVGAQTSRALSAMAERTEQAARAAAQAVHEAYQQSAGNGSLMRTGPLALGYLGEGRQPALVEAASRVAQLTHWEPDNADACALWSLAIRHAVLTGELDLAGQLVWLPEQWRQRWAELIVEAQRPGVHPREFRADNGWVVAAFQAAIAAVTGASTLVEALERAVRGGRDTDTVAAITGSLAGAVHGGTAVPVPWLRILHGWPGLRASDFTRLAVLAARGGTGDGHGWPLAAREPVYADELHRHPHDEGVWLGTIAALDRLATDAPEVDAVISLCRVGSAQVPEGVESVQVWLIDQPGRNLNLEHTLRGTAELIAQLRAEGRHVLVHCAEARSRTAAVATAYAALHRGIRIDQAWTDIAATLPGFAPQPFLREAVNALS